MSRVSDNIAVTYAVRHCTEYGCRKCAARGRWHKRKAWRSRKTLTRYRTGKK
jgi:hypothetical protein